MPEPEPVPVRDLEVADRIARAVRGRGGPADRQPTLEQLCRGLRRGRADTADARRRAARALALAGVATRARPARGDAGRAGRARGASRPPAAARCWSACSRSSRSSPPRSPWPRRSTSATTTPRPTSPRDHDDRPRDGDEHRDAGDDVDGDDAGAPHGRRAAPGQAPSRAPRPRAARQGTEGQGEARQGQGPGGGQAARHRAPHGQPRRPSCASRGDGKELFDGTLSGARTFRGRVVRLNVGLGPSTRVTANGKAVRLTASPTGSSDPQEAHVPAARRAPLRVASSTRVYRAALAWRGPTGHRRLRRGRDALGAPRVAGDDPRGGDAGPLALGAATLALVLATVVTGALPGQRARLAPRLEERRLARRLEPEVLVGAAGGRAAARRALDAARAGAGRARRRPRSCRPPR